MTNQDRILVIGIDGGSLDLIKSWADQGHLPFLKHLMSSGGYSKLTSVYPVISSAAWVTFMTGVNPGKHNIFDFVYRENDGYQLKPITSDCITEPTLWNLLSNEEKRVVVINVPITYPPEKVNGTLISGLGTPEYKPFTYPPEFSHNLWKNGYHVNREYINWYGKEDAFLKESFSRIDQTTAIALSLLNDDQWNFGIVVYRETDEVGHGYWHLLDHDHPKYIYESPHKNAILNIYKKIDSCIGELISAAGKQTTFFVISDHGLGPLYKDVYLNEWLRQNGYLTLKSPPIHHQILSKLGLTRNKISRYFRKYGFYRTEIIIKDLIKDRIRLLPKDNWADFNEGIDWKETRAYSYGYQGQIFVNLKGREPLGIVSTGGEYENIRADIVRELKKWRDPSDGLPIVDSVFYGEDIYHGSYVKNAPDIILSMRNLSYLTRLGYEMGNKPGEIISDSSIQETGSHRLNGVLIASGPKINPKMGEKESAWIGDLAPTILYMMDCHIPKNMDGKILMDWLDPTITSLQPTYIDLAHLDVSNRKNTMTEYEEKELLQRLKDLGYVK